MRWWSAGFAFVDIQPELNCRTGKEKIIDITFNVVEGPKVYGAYQYLR